MEKRVALFIVALVCAVTTAIADKPNVLLILADDLGYGDLSCHGSDEIRTPNIDALAASGIRFTEGYVPSSVCGPSRACLMTGQYAVEFGVRGNGDVEFGLPFDRKNIAEYLKQGSDYYTAVLGKWHLGERSADQTPMARGFDHFLGFLNGKSHYWPFSGAGQKQINNTDDFPTQRNDKILTPEDLPPETYMTDLLTQEAVEIIQGSHGRGRKPFFIYLAYNAPHGPLHAPEAYRQRNSHITEKARNIFAGMMTGLDDGVGRVIAALKAEGLYENTLVVFLSDNGGPTKKNTSKNTPFRGVKGEVWEGGVRVPFMVSWPARIKPGQVRTEPVCSFDLAPTIVSLAGLEVDPTFDGIDLSAWLTGEQKTLPDRDLYYWRAGNRGLRSGRYKYERHGDMLELFDIQANPVEDPAHKLDAPERQSAMAGRLSQWEDTWPAGISEGRKEEPKDKPAKVAVVPMVDPVDVVTLAEWAFDGSFDVTNLAFGITATGPVFNRSFEIAEVDRISDCLKDSFGFGNVKGHSALFVHRSDTKKGSSWGFKGGTAVTDAPVYFTVGAGAGKSVVLTGLAVTHAGGPKLMLCAQEAGMPQGPQGKLGGASSPLTVSFAVPISIPAGESKTFTVKLNSGKYGSTHMLDHISLIGTVDP